MKVEATVTTADEKGIKLTADWPLAWLQAPGSTTIVRKLIPGDHFENPVGPSQRSELGGYQPQVDLQMGDRVVVELYWPSGSA
jgi:hypothetical protein